MCHELSNILFPLFSVYVKILNEVGAGNPFTIPLYSSMASFSEEKKGSQELSILWTNLQLLAVRRPVTSLPISLMHYFSKKSNSPFCCSVLFTWWRSCFGICNTTAIRGFTLINALNYRFHLQLISFIWNVTELGLEIG